MLVSARISFNLEIGTWSLINLLTSPRRIWNDLPLQCLPERPSAGTDSKTGTLSHEASHFTINGGIDDYVYGRTAAESLTQTNPSSTPIITSTSLGTTPFCLKYHRYWDL